MGRKLVYKVVVDGIEPMDADTLEAVRICGWRVVCKKGDFHVGDTVLYFEPDAALNCHDERFAFLKERCYKRFNLHGMLFDECLRIRTMKLRGVVSQGLLMKPELFCEVRNKKLHEDCSDILMVRHYDEVAEKVAVETGALKYSSQKGKFPPFIPKTDEERIQNIEDATLEQFADVPLECSEKVDGMSMTVFYAPLERPDDPFGVCSRNFELKDEPSPYWDMVHALKLDENLKAYCEEKHVALAIQGELTGPGIQNNRDSLAARRFCVFRIWDISNQKMLTWSHRYDVCDTIGLLHVRVLGTYTLRDFGLDRDRILEFAEGKTENGNEREGVVFKSVDGLFTFKAVSNRYLLGLK